MDPADELQAWVGRLPAAVRPLAARGSLRRFRPGTVIIQEGTRGEEIYFLLEGRVRAYSAASNEREVSFAIDGAGDCFGEIALDGGPRSASVVALEATACVVVPCDVVWDHVARDPAFARTLIERLIARTRWTTERARELALFDVYGRLRRLLESLAGSGEGERPIAERLTHQGIASRLGSSREMVTRLMKDLERGGYIRNARGSVTLLKPLPERW